MNLNGTTYDNYLRTKTFVRLSADLRLKEAQKLGFKKAIMPKNGNYSSHDIEIIKLGHVRELREIFNYN